MTEINETTGSGDASPSSGMDRRSALKKVAVGGAIAWSVPTVLSSKASAQVDPPFCTPKCYPDPVAPTIQPVAMLFCPNPGQKWVRIDFSIPTGGCPCGGNTLLAVQDVTVTNGNAALKDEFFDTSTGMGYFVFGGPGNGALSNGTYDFVYTFQLICTDRDGDRIAQNCNQGVRFTFTPANSECSAPGNVGAAQVVAGGGCGSITCLGPGTPG